MGKVKLYRGPHERGDHDLTQEQCEQLYASQNGQCAKCGKWDPYHWMYVGTECLVCFNCRRAGGIGPGAKK